MKLKAFTLAEVLITLMIIGIVAALTIPSVISNYQQQEFKTGLKKAVSVLNEAIQMNINQTAETPSDTEGLLDYFAKSMSMMEYGNSYAITEQRREQYGNEFFYTTDGMRFEFPNHANENSFRLHESDFNLNSSCIRGRFKNDYQCYGIGSAHCGSYGLANNKNDSYNAPCIIIVDVNGDKKPNPIVEVTTHPQYGYKQIEGKYLYPVPSEKKLTDVFPIMITEEKAIPFGVVAQRAMYSK